MFGKAQVFQSGAGGRSGLCFTDPAQGHQGCPLHIMLPVYLPPLGSAHRWEKGSEGFMTHKAPKRQYFDDLSISDWEHVGFISCRILLGLKMKGKHAWQSSAQLS